MTSSAQDISLIIKTLDHKQYTVKLLATASVPQLKEKVASETGVGTARQRLIFRGKVLKNEENIATYAIEDGHTLHLVVRPENAPTSQEQQHRNDQPNPTTQPREIIVEAENIIGAPHNRVVMGATITVPEGSDISGSTIGSLISNLVQSLHGSPAANVSTSPSIPSIPVSSSTSAPTSSPSTQQSQTQAFTASTSATETTTHARNARRNAVLTTHLDRNAGLLERLDQLLGESDGSLEMIAPVRQDLQRLDEQISRLSDRFSQVLDGIKEIPSLLTTLVNQPSGSPPDDASRRLQRNTNMMHCLNEWLSGVTRISSLARSNGAVGNFISISTDSILSSAGEGSSGSDATREGLASMIRSMHEAFAEAGSRRSAEESSPNTAGRNSRAASRGSQSTPARPSSRRTRTNSSATTPLNRGWNFTLLGQRLGELIPSGFVMSICSGNRAALQELLADLGTVFVLGEGTPRLHHSNVREWSKKFCGEVEKILVRKGLPQTVQAELRAKDTRSFVVELVGVVEQFLPELIDLMCRAQEATPRSEAYLEVAEPFVGKLINAILKCIRQQVNDTLELTEILKQILVFYGMDEELAQFLLNKLRKWSRLTEFQSPSITSSSNSSNTRKVNPDDSMQVSKKRRLD